MPTVAIIDMGTNTFHLLIARVGGKPEIIARDRVAVKIGQGGINNGSINQAGARRALMAMIKFRKIIDSYRVDEIVAYGTSALRNAANNQDIIDGIRAATGINTTIIDGSEEAELIYKGVTLAIDTGDEASLMVDIGGGSVEFIIGNNSTVSWKQSIEVGGQRLLEKFHHTEPISPAEIKALESYLDTQLAPVFEAIRHYNPATMIGVSGTFDTISEIYCRRKNIPYVDTDPETPVLIDAVPAILEEIITRDRAGRMNIPGMIEMRVEMIVVACCLLRRILNKHSFRRLRVSSYSLKEGALRKFLG
jgi:exopolyphosphatase / guanosine-5'-triphosphate,3'-diphosphate pyrophosphatase